MSAEELARLFHEAYERLAPGFGYATRSDTRAFFPESPNGRLMIAVADEVLAALATPAPGAPAGFKLVPIEPTEAMMNAAFQAHEDKPLTDWGKIVPANDDEIYRAMLDAAPGAPGQEATAVQAVGAWQDIATAPKDDSRVLLYRAEWCEDMAVGWWNRSGYWQPVEGNEFPDATHWMPLPPRPGAGEKTS